MLKRTLVANLYMEHLEREALRSAPTPPRHWFRYVDDTFVIQQQANKQVFLDHINSIDPAIQFTVEGNQDTWIPWAHPRQTIPYLLQYTAHTLTLTSTYSGIAITVSMLSTVSLVPLQQQKQKQHRTNCGTQCTRTGEKPKEDL